MKSSKLLPAKVLLLSILLIFSACKSGNSIKKSNQTLNKQEELQNLLEFEELNDKQRYSIIKQMADSLLAQKDYHGLILFLTDWVDKNPGDMYNSYWLLMTAYAYLSTGAEPLAEYYLTVFYSSVRIFW